MVVAKEESLLKNQYDQNWNRHRHLDLLFWGTPITAVGLVGVTVIQLLNADVFEFLSGIILIVLGLFCFVLASQVSKIYQLMNQHSVFINDLEKSNNLKPSPFKSNLSAKIQTSEEANHDSTQRAFWIKLKYIIQLNGIINFQKNHSSRRLVVIFMNYLWIIIVGIGIIEIINQISLFFSYI